MELCGLLVTVYQYGIAEGVEVETVIHEKRFDEV